MRDARQKRTEINAIYEDDVDETLNRLGILDRYSDGTLRCSACGRVLLNVGVGAVRMAGDLQVVCARLECVREIA